MARMGGFMYQRAITKSKKVKQLLVYDISDKKRLQKCHRACLQKAIALQNSVFMFDGLEQELLQLTQNINQIINEREDSFWTFDIAPNAYSCQIGMQDFVNGLNLKGTLCQKDLII